MTRPPPPFCAMYAVLALSALLGLGFAAATPLGGAPDEAAHVRYVEVLATQGKLPRLNMAHHRDPNAPDRDYESHQAPLYYGLAVPFYLVGRAVAGDPGAGQACRLLSLLIGLGGTALVWLIARELVPERPALWTAAAAIAAFLPMRLAVSASVSNDSLAEATSSLAVLLMLRALRGPWTLRQAAWLGGAIGLALLSKQSGILLLPPTLAAIFLASRNAAAPAPAPPAVPETKGQKRKRAAPPRAGDTLPDEDASRAAALPLFVRTGAVTAGVALLLSGWWFARNAAIYGDPLAQRAFNWYFEDTPRWEQFRDAGIPYAVYLGRLVFLTTFASFWGAFGHLSHPADFMGAYDPRDAPWDGLHPVLQILWPVWWERMRIPPPSWLYPILVLLTLLAVAAGVRYYLRWRRSWDQAPAGSPTLQGIGVLALHGLFVCASLLRFNATYFQAQGRYLFPAIAGFALALAAGWLEWPRKRQWPPAALIAGGMLALATYALFGVVWPDFRSG